MDLHAEARTLSDALGRPVRAELRWGSWRVIQRCLVCNEEVLSSFDGTSVPRDVLHAKLFGHYDGHRCARELNVVFSTDEELDALYARTESESLRLAERASALAAAADPLAVRAERESELLAIWASWLSREVTTRTA